VPGNYLKGKKKTHIFFFAAKLKEKVNLFLNIIVFVIIKNNGERSN
jgi:hypothetical protein